MSGAIVEAIKTIIERTGRYEARTWNESDFDWWGVAWRTLNETKRRSGMAWLVNNKGEVIEGGEYVGWDGSPGQINYVAVSLHDPKFAEKLIEEIDFSESRLENFDWGEDRVEAKRIWEKHANDPLPDDDEFDSDKDRFVYDGF
jgi:hypothetical protein